jgi:hypothetical protein
MTPDGGPKSFGYHGCAVQAISPGNVARGENPHSSADDRGPRKGLCFSGVSAGLFGRCCRAQVASASSDHASLSPGSIAASGGSCMPSRARPGEPGWGDPL